MIKVKYHTPEGLAKIDSVIQSIHPNHIICHPSFLRKITVEEWCQLNYTPQDKATVKCGICGTIGLRIISYFADNVQKKLETKDVCNRLLYDQFFFEHIYQLLIQQWNATMIPTNF